MQFIRKHVDNKSCIFNCNILSEWYLSLSRTWSKCRLCKDRRWCQLIGVIYFHYILRVLLSWLHHTRCLCSYRQEVAAVFWWLQPDWEALPRSPCVYQQARAVSVRQHQGSLERQPGGEWAGGAERQWHWYQQLCGLRHWLETLGQS